MIVTSNIMRRLIYKRCAFQMLPFKSADIFCDRRRSFHCNPQLYKKMFMEHENRYAYNIMENKGYAISFDNKEETVQLDQKQFDELMQENWSKRNPNDLFEYFPKLGSYCSIHGLSISNKIFDSYIDNLTDNIKSASDKELVSLFYSLNKWPEPDSIRTRNYIEVWVALDDECLNRIRKWNFDEMLLFMSLFFMLNVTRVSDFSQKVLLKLASKAKQLTPNQLVQTMFFIGVFRRPPLDMHNLEIELENQFEHFSIDDLAIISMGFFKSKTPIRSMDLVAKIIDKVIENSEHIHEVSLAALLKVIRYSIKISKKDKLYQLLDTLQHEIPRLSVMCNVHLALLGTTTLTLHKRCLSQIATTVISNISKARTKDLERLVLTYGIFNIRPDTKECFFQKVMDELKKPERNKEIDKHGRSFACCIAYLGLLGIYPVDLMNKVLSSEFLNNTYGKQCAGYGKEILTIHNSAELFCKDVEMNRLTDKCACILAKKYTDFVPSENFTKQYNVTEKFYLYVKKILKDLLGGEEYIVGDHILTHHQRGDLIICKDVNGTPLQIADVWDYKKFGLIRKLPDKNIWIVFIIAGRSAVLHNNGSLTGPFQSKLRELKALGYHPTLVNHDKFVSLENDDEKRQYINKLMIEAVQNKC